MRRFLAALIVVLGVLGGAEGASAQALRTLQNSLSRSMKWVGSSTGAQVVDLTTGRTLYSVRPGSRRLPASVEKIYTTSTALARFGANTTLKTSVRATGSLDARGTWHGTLYLKGAGDPTFGSVAYDRNAYGTRTGATLQRLVTNLLRTNRIKAVRGAIVGDESTLDSLRGTVATGFAFSPYIEGELSGLAYNRGFADTSGASIQNRPALFATQQFVAALRASGVQVPKNTRVYTHAAPAGALKLATVNSPRMATLIRMTNTPSDNFFAEMLLKDVGARFGGKGSSAAGAGVVRRQLASTFNIHPRIDDGSGLSRGDWTSPRDVVTVLAGLSADAAFTNSLSVAGETGTLAAGLQGTYAQGRCRGKSGTLHDVANLVGLCTAKDGHTLAFAFLFNGLSDPAAGHAIEDGMAVAVAKYNG
jgi:D-alanyl-D-alanine carboxypeptidase/D-alanyl-D-alanine-endopeptidase (penicillin-binding protein 4)